MDFSNGFYIAINVFWSTRGLLRVIVAIECGLVVDDVMMLRRIVVN